MKLPPVSVLKTWPQPNYVNPETRGNTLIIFNSVFLGLMTIIIVLRIYTRLIVKRWFGWDDFYIICAYICTVLMNATVDLGSEKYFTLPFSFDDPYPNHPMAPLPIHVALNGWNRHEWDIPLSMASTSFKVAFFAKLSFLFAGFFTASSLLAFYYRLIQESRVKWFRIALHCSVAFNILAWLPFVFTEIFICVPTYAYWTFPEPAGSKCMLEGPVTMVGGLVKIVVDLLITTLPIPLILRMNMQKRQRYLVVLLLALGYVATAAGAVRAYFTWKAFYDTNDQTWYQYPAFVAAALENNLAIICACIPTIRPLFPHLFGGPVSRIKNWMSSKASSNQNSTVDMSGSHGSRHSRNRSKLGSNSINKLAISAPINSASSRSSDAKLVIQQTESFELTEKSIYAEGPRSGSAERPDYYHFGPRHDDIAGFHAV